MRFEDVSLYVVLGPEFIGRADAASLCEAMMKIGADAVELTWDGSAQAQNDAAMAIAEKCRRNDTFLFVGDDAGAVHAIGADGVCIGRAEDSIGEARAKIGMERLVGIASRNEPDVRMAVGLDPDFVVHYGGMESKCVFSSLMVTHRLNMPMFVAGLSGADEARMVVEGGLHRLCVESTMFGEGDPVEVVAAFSRLLGRGV